MPLLSVTPEPEVSGPTTITDTPPAMLPNWSQILIVTATVPLLAMVCGATQMLNWYPVGTVGSDRPEQCVATDSSSPMPSVT